MGTKKARQIILYTLLGFSIFTNICLVSEIKYYFKASHLISIDENPHPTLKDLSTFRQKLLEGAKKELETEDINDIDFPYKQLLFTDQLKQDIENSNRIKYPAYKCSEYGYLLLSVIDDAILHKDIATLKYCQRIFEDKILQHEITIPDQSQAAMASLKLYDIFHKESYRTYADSMYSFLTSSKEDSIVPYRSKSSIVIVDVIGMAVPFLIMYANYFSNESAKELATSTLVNYIDFGCDSSTGMPVFSYRKEEPHIKMGAANWGRGTSWFVLGLVDIINIDTTPSITEENEKISNTLTSMWQQDLVLSQFIGEKQRPDLSAELPILYYLQKNKKIHLNSKDILAYSTYMYEDQMYQSSSGNNGIIRYGAPYGRNLLTQAFMLKLCNEVP